MEQAPAAADAADAPGGADRAAAGGRVRGVAWAVASASAFSLTAAVGKDLIGALGVASVLFWRFAIASLVLWAMIALGRRRPLAAPWMRLLGLGVLFGVLDIVGFMALERLDASVYIVLVYLYPAFVVAASAALGQPVDRITVVALLLVTAGVVITVPDVFTAGGRISAVGVVLALGQAVLFACFLLLNSRYVPSTVDPFVVVGWTNLGALLVLAPVALVGGLVVPRGWDLIAEVLLLALIPTVAAFTFLVQALRHVVPGVAAMILTLEVALAIVWSVLFLGEHVGAVEWLGALVVIAGVVLAQRPRAAVEPAPAVPAHPA